MKKPELKPCPFCGCPVDITSIQNNGAKYKINGRFRCLSCHTTFALVATYTVQHPLQALYEKWNRRAGDADAMVKWEDEGCPPTIDAVPVVRCRECRHRQNTKECLMCFTEVVDVEDGKLYQFRDLTKDDGFCDRGERRDNDAQAD